MAEQPRPTGGMSFIRNFFGGKSEAPPRHETEPTQPLDDKTTQSVLGDFADAVDFQAARLRRPARPAHSGSGGLPVGPGSQPPSGFNASTATAPFDIFSASTPFETTPNPDAPTLSPDAPSGVLVRGAALEPEPEPRNDRTVLGETSWPETAMPSADAGTPSTWATPAGGLRMDPALLPPARHPETEEYSSIDETDMSEEITGPLTGDISSRELVTESLYEELDSIFGTPAKKAKP